MHSFKFQCICCTITHSHNQVLLPWSTGNRGCCDLWPRPWHTGSQVWGQMARAPCSYRGNASCCPGCVQSRCETSSLRGRIKFTCSANNKYLFLIIQHFARIYLALWSWCCHCVDLLCPVRRWPRSNQRRTSQTSPQSCSAVVKSDHSDVMTYLKT